MILSAYQSYTEVEYDCMYYSQHAQEHQLKPSLLMLKGGKNSGISFNLLFSTKELGKCFTKHYQLNSCVCLTLDLQDKIQNLQEKIYWE